MYPEIKRRTGVELRRTGRTYPAVTRGIKMHGKWYKRTRQDDRHFAWYILNVHADSLLNGEIHCRVSQTELMELMKETIDYLEGIQKENKQIGVDMEKIQEKYGLPGKDMPERERTERMQKQGHIFTNKIQKESVPKLL